MVNDLYNEGIDFPVAKKDFSKIEQKNIICINVSCHENDLAYSVCESNEKLKNCMDLLLIANENKSHYGYVKDFNRFKCNKTKDNNEKHFCRYYLQCFTCKSLNRTQRTLFNNKCKIKK